MTAAAVAALGTFLYQGAFFSGTNAARSCAESLRDVVARMEHLEIRVLTSTCAPRPVLGSPDSGFQVQIQVASREVGATMRIDRDAYRSSTDCRENLKKIQSIRTPEIPIINAFCKDSELVIDSLPQRGRRLQWDLTLATYPDAQACAQTFGDVAEKLRGLGINAYFSDCERIQLGPDRVFGWRLKIATQTPTPKSLGFHDEVPFDSATECMSIAAETGARLHTLGLGTGWYSCSSAGYGKTAGRHLILDRYPGRIAHLPDGPIYAELSACRTGSQSIAAYLESEGNQIISERCLAQSRSGYRVWIDYLRAPVTSTSLEGPLPPL